MSMTALAVGVLLALLGLILWGAGWIINQLSAVLLPLAIAGVIAFLLDPVVDYFVTLKVPRLRAVLLVFFMATMLVLGLLATIVPRVVRETNSLAKSLPKYSEDLRKWANDSMAKPRFGIELPAWWPWHDNTTNAAPDAATNDLQGTSRVATNSTVEAESQTGTATNRVDNADSEETTPPRFNKEFGDNLLSWITKALPTLPRVGKWFLDQMSKVASWAGLLIGLSLVPVYSFYFLLEKRGIERNWTDYLPIHESRTKDELVFVLSSINNYLIVFFRGQVLVALCDGVLYTIGFLIVGLPYAFLIGLAAGLLSIVPFLGFVISLVPALILSVVQFGDWLHPVLTLLVFGVVQSVEGLFISPKIMGDRVGLHPLTIIIAVMAGTTLMGGILGGILAIPLTAALRVLMFRYVWKKRSGSSGTA